MTQPTAADTTNTQDPEQRAAALQQIWEETMAMEPDPNDPRYQSDPNSDYQTDYENWAKKMQLLGSMVNAAQNVASKKDTAVSQAQEQQRIGLAADSNATQRSVADINRYLGIQDESTKRANLQQQAREQVMKYGTSGGKTKFSAADFGGALSALAGQAGLGANDTIIAYPGFQSMNPGADLAAYDQSGGASGPAPSIAAPTFTGGNALPTVASYASAPPAAPTFTAPFKTDVNTPDGSVDLSKWLADHRGGRNAPPAVGNVTSVLTPSVTSALPTPGTSSMLPWWLQKAGAR